MHGSHQIGKNAIPPAGADHGAARGSDRAADPALQAGAVWLLRFQLSGVKDISYFEFAQEFIRRNGFSEKLVKKDSWKNKLQFTPTNFTSLVNI